MKEYLLAAVVATDSFSRPLTKTVLEDGVYKRMIKSLGQLNCHTQVLYASHALDVWFPTSCVWGPTFGLLKVLRPVVQ